jgi:hypothetical protein
VRIELAFSSIFITKSSADLWFSRDGIGFNTMMRIADLVGLKTSSSDESTNRSRRPTSSRSSSTSLRSRRRCRGDRRHAPRRGRSGEGEYLYDRGALWRVHGGFAATGRMHRGIPDEDIRHERSRTSRRPGSRRRLDRAQEGRLQAELRRHLLRPVHRRRQKRERTFPEGLGFFRRIQRAGSCARPAGNDLGV